MLDKDGLEKIVEKTDLLYQAWRDCMECQYNQYLCAYHQPLLEPIFVIWAAVDGYDVENMQISGDGSEVR